MCCINSPWISHSMHAHCRKHVRNASLLMYVVIQPAERHQVVRLENWSDCTNHCQPAQERNRKILCTRIYNPWFMECIEYSMSQNWKYKTEWGNFFFLFFIFFICNKTAWLWRINFVKKFTMYKCHTKMYVCSCCCEYS